MSKLREILKETSTNVDLDITLDQDIINAGMFQRVDTPKGEALIKHIAKFLHALTFTLQAEHTKLLDGQPADSGWDVLFASEENCSDGDRRLVKKPKEKVLAQMSNNDGTEIGQEAAVETRIVSYGLGRESRQSGEGGLPAKGGRTGVWAYELGTGGSAMVAHQEAGDYDYDYGNYEGEGPRDAVSNVASRKNRVYETWYERKSQAGTHTGRFKQSDYHQGLEDDYWGDIMNARIYGSSKDTSGLVYWTWVRGALVGKAEWEDQEDKAEQWNAGRHGGGGTAGREADWGQYKYMGPDKVPPASKNPSFSNIGSWGTKDNTQDWPGYKPASRFEPAYFHYRSFNIIANGILDSLFLTLAFSDSESWYFNHFFPEDGKVGKVRKTKGNKPVVPLFPVYAEGDHKGPYRTFYWDKKGPRSPSVETLSPFNNFGFKPGTTAQEMGVGLYRRWSIRIAALSAYGCDEANAPGRAALDSGDFGEEWMRNRRRNEGRQKVAVARAELALGIYQKAPYREQCYLLSRIFTLVDWQKKIIYKKAGKRMPYYLQATRDYELDAKRDATLLAWMKDTSDPVLGYMGNASIPVDGGYDFINVLTQNPNLKTLWEIDPGQVSALQPQIRLFKVEMDQESKQLAEREIVFDSVITPRDLQLFQTRSKRGVGAGIKSFSFTYDGYNPFAAKKSIKAQLVIFANDFEELLRDRGGYKYVDLALKTGAPLTAGATETDDEDPMAGTTGVASLEHIAAQAAEDALDKLRFKLKAVVGISSPNAYTRAQSSLFQSGVPLGDALESSYATLQLTPTTHQFNVNDSGQVTMTINYLAYVEDFFNSPIFNIFTNVEIAQRGLLRRLQLRKLPSICEDEELSEFKEKELDESKKDARRSLVTLIHQLHSTERLHYISMSYDELKHWRARGPFAPAPTKQIQMGIDHGGGINTRVEAMRGAFKRKQNEEGSAISDLSAEDQQAVFSHITTDMNSVNLPFFYVADLIDMVLANIEAHLTELPKLIQNWADLPKFITEDDIAHEVDKLSKFQAQFKQFRAVLGPLEIVDHSASPVTSKFVNFGAVPVSLKYFMEWMTDKLLKKEEVVYPLPSFLNDFFNDLIRNYLNDDSCFNYPIQQKIRNTQTALSAYNDHVQTNITSDAAVTTPIDGLTQYWAEQKSSEYQLETGTDSLKRNYRPPDANRFDLEMTQRIVHDHAYDMGRGPWQPLLDMNGERAVKQRVLADPTVNFNYLVFSAGRIRPKERMQGDYDQDMADGRWHFQTGLDRGVTRTISLKKSTAPGLQEVRFEQEGYDGLTQLRETYDAEIKTYPLPGIYPGIYIYVDPRSWTPGSTRYITDYSGETIDLTDLGLGGYYMVVKAQTDLAPGKMETKITAKWVAQIESEAEAAAKAHKKATSATAKADQATKCASKQLTSEWTPGVAAAAGPAAAADPADADSVSKPVGVLVADPAEPSGD